MKTPQRLVIAIDGPSGSGKSTTSRQVARRLGLEYLDTGAMYRAVAVAYLDAGVDQDDPAGIIRATLDADIDISTDPDDFWVTVNGRDVTREIRQPRISAKVSAVATLPECRADLVRRQRAIVEAAGPGIVAEGRDVTTVIAPDADVRVLLTASPEERMARRSGEHRGALAAEQLRDQVLRRDRDDSRLVEFQSPAAGVTLLDTTGLTPPEVVERIVAMAEEVRP